MLTPQHQRQLIDAFESVKKVLAEPGSDTDAQPVKELSSMTIKRDKDPNKFSVSHKTRDGKSETHAVDRAGLVAHVAKHWQLDNDANNETEE